VGSWLLDLAASALAKDPPLDAFAGRVADSGEGRWMAEAAIEEGAPVPVLAAALFQRFASRGEDEFSRRLLSALRAEFGGHGERPG
jgi:6-phosphogluconate dehydrogenase